MRISEPDVMRPAGAPRNWLFLLGSLFCLLVSGCGGCQDDATSDSAATNSDATSKPDEKPKESFEIGPLVMYPGEFSDESRVNRFKSGHFATTSLRLTSNKSDVSGRMQTYSISAGNQAVPVEGTGSYVLSERPVSLAREEQKNLETLVFLPHRDFVPASISLRTQVIAPSGLPLVDTSGGAISLKPWQYHMLLLSSQPDQLKYLQVLDCIRLPAFDTIAPPPFYHVVRTTAGDPVPLSSTVQGWSTIAYLVWDGYDPELLEENQKQALLDWLHYGGQLVINGPGSLSRLQGSFLDRWLPATEGASRNLASEQFEQFNNHWAVPSNRSPSGSHRLEIPANAPMLGIELQPRAGAEMVTGADGLVVERMVGRGRIVVTAFSLRDPRLKRWGGISSFFNSALLRKPARKFDQGPDNNVSFAWRAPAGTFDLGIGSTLRYLVRDLNPDVSGAAPSQPVAVESGMGFDVVDYASPDGRLGDEDPAVFSRPGNPESSTPDDFRLFDGTTGQPDSGVAAWNDEYGIAQAARQAITHSAGIRPPSRKFVIQMLGGYLLVLVPLNWLLFRLLGRVEWAWIAAPVIAVVAALLVVRLASLDIGFARSQTVIGVLEMHGDYSRAHLTEYSALYTSLSTSYALQFDDAGGVALPFRGSGKQRDGSQLDPVVLERSINNRMKGFPVKSNSTRSLHVETMIDAGGALRLERADDGRYIIVNGTRFEIDSTGIVSMTEAGQYQAAWIGALAAGQSVEIRFQQVQASQLYNSWAETAGFVSFEKHARKLWLANNETNSPLTLDETVAASGLDEQKQTGFRDYLIRQVRNGNRPGGADSEMLFGFDAFRTALEIYGSPDDELGHGMGAVFDAIRSQWRIGPGQMRLFGAIRQPAGTHTLVPEATQKTHATLLVAHLRPAMLPPAAPDSNALQDFLAKQDQDRWLREIEDINKSLPDAGDGKPGSDEGNPAEEDGLGPAPGDSGSG